VKKHRTLAPRRLSIEDYAFAHPAPASCRLREPRISPRAASGLPPMHESAAMRLWDMTVTGCLSPPTDMPQRDAHDGIREKRKAT
jgi:hypothetical protein